MGLFGGSSNRGGSDEEAARSEGASELLNTQDLRRGSSILFDADHDFQRMTRWYSHLSSIAGEGSGWERGLRKAVDCGGTGDDKVNKEDFRAIHAKVDGWMTRREGSLDRHLPWMGQFAFGTTLGFVGARCLKAAYRHKFKFALGGLVLFNLNDLLASPETPEQAFAKQQYEAAVVAKDGWLRRYNLATPGTADRAVLLDNVRLNWVNRKLGPGGLAEGPSGVGAVLFGLWWGLRVI